MCYITLYYITFHYIIIFILYIILGYTILSYIVLYYICLLVLNKTHMYALDLSHVPILVPKARLAPQEEELHISHVKASWMF